MPPQSIKGVMVFHAHWADCRVTIVLGCLMYVVLSQPVMVPASCMSADIAALIAQETLFGFRLFEAKWHWLLGSLIALRSGFMPDLEPPLVLGDG